MAHSPTLRLRLMHVFVTCGVGLVGLTARAEPPDTGASSPSSPQDIPAIARPRNDLDLPRCLDPRAGPHPADIQETQGARPPDVTAVALPIAGLAVALPAARWTVAGRWDAHARTEWLVLEDAGVAGVREACTRRYGIALDGLTAKDCPFAEAVIAPLATGSWSSGRAADGAHALCLRIAGLRLVVSLDAPRTPDALDATVLDALATAVLTRSAPPQPAPAAVTPLPSLTLPLTGFSLATPVRERWLVTAPRSRDFDALIRDIPQLPEMQVAIRRFDTATGATCDHVVDALLKTGFTPASKALADLARSLGFARVASRTLGGFTTIALCTPIGGALLDARLSVNPPLAAAPAEDTGVHTNGPPTATTDLAKLTPVLASLAGTRATHPGRLASPPLSSERAWSLWSVALAGAHAAGLPSDRTLPPPPPMPAFAGLEVGAHWQRLNGPRLRGAASIGLDGRGLAHAATAEVGVSLGLSPVLSLSLSIGALERRDGLMSNVALHTSFEFASAAFRVGAPSWTLRVTPLLLASREPALTGLPFELSWQATLPSGLILGLDLRSISRPLAPSRAWPADGVALGLRLGFGKVGR